MSDNLPVLRKLDEVEPFVAALFEEHYGDKADEVADSPTGEAILEIASMAIERFGAEDGQDVVDRTLTLVVDLDADPDIIKRLLQRYGMPEIQVCYEAAMGLIDDGFDSDDDPSSTSIQAVIELLLQFRRYFSDVAQTDDLAELINEMIMGLNTELPTSVVLAQLITLGKDLNTHDLRRVRAHYNPREG